MKKTINNPILGFKRKLNSLEEDLESLGLQAQDLEYAKKTNLFTLKENFFDLDEEDTNIEYESKWEEVTPLDEVTLSINAGGGFPAGGPFIKNEYPVMRRSPLKAPKKKK